MPVGIKGTDTLAVMLLCTTCICQLISPVAAFDTRFSVCACSATRTMLLWLLRWACADSMTSMTAGPYSTHPPPDICVGIEPGQAVSSGSYVIRIPYAPAGSLSPECSMTWCYLIACHLPRAARHTCAQLSRTLSECSRPCAIELSASSRTAMHRATWRLRYNCVLQHALSHREEHFYRYFTHTGVRLTCAGSPCTGESGVQAASHGLPGWQ